MKKNNVVLIGFMGSGKTTIGLRLSYCMRRVVEDTDKLIEKKTGRSISDIFAADGENSFRNMETEMLKELKETCRNKIISVGGGTPLREENRKLLKDLGHVIYLRVTPETVMKRLQGDTTRPLLQVEDPQEKIRKMMADRKFAYETCADFVIDTDDLQINRIVDMIESYLAEKERME